MSDETVPVILLDNGSLRPESTLNLRRLATALGQCLGCEVAPVSLLHSSKVDAEKLGGQRAQTLVPYLRQQREQGRNRFWVLPLFFGPSGALVDYLPRRIAELQTEGWQELQIDVAECLVDESGQDLAVAKILAGQVRRTIAQRGWQRPAVAMVDHGTPSAAVNAVRELVAQQLAAELAEEVSHCRGCSMERREGAKYDFNEPLLERLLGQNGFTHQVVVSMLFVGPGRHAGAGGDVETICRHAMEACPGLEAALTGLVSEDQPALVGVLQRRYRDLVAD